MALLSRHCPAAQHGAAILTDTTSKARDLGGVCATAVVARAAAIRMLFRISDLEVLDGRTVMKVPAVGGADGEPEAPPCYALFSMTKFILFAVLTCGVSAVAQEPAPKRAGVVRIGVARPKVDMGPGAGGS